MERIESTSPPAANAVSAISSPRSRKFYFAFVAALGIVIFCAAPKVFLLFFCCVLFAILLTALCGFIERHTPLQRRWSLTITVTALLGSALLTGWLLGPQINAQFSQLGAQLPRALEHAREQIASTKIGAQLLQFVGGSSWGALSKASNALSATIGVLVQFFVVFFVGLYLASNPRLYVEGFARLFPDEKRSRISEILHAIGDMLRGWLMGRLLLMGSNGIVTALGLWIMGVPLPVTLGLISAILNFIPNFGPWIAAAPAVLLAFMESPNKAMQVAFFYLVYQMFDGFVLTPLVQSRTASVPSALVLMSQVLFGVLFGAVGVLVAVPLAVVALVLMRELHVKDVLHERNLVLSNSG